jgi:hypothetical protein
MVQVTTGTPLGLGASEIGRNTAGLLAEHTQNGLHWTTRIAGFASAIEPDQGPPWDRLEALGAEIAGAEVTIDKS